MLTLSETDCKLFLRYIYMAKWKASHAEKEYEGFFRDNFLPPYPPSGANFTTEQISCKSMVHHEPWGINRLICSLPAVYRSCELHICPRYPVHKCLMPLASFLILLSGNASHCVPLCRVLLTALRVYPFSKNETGFSGFLRKDLSLQNAAQNEFRYLNLEVNHGVENHAG